MLVQFTYRVEYFAVSGGSDWTNSRNYTCDVQGKAPGGAVARRDPTDDADVTQGQASANSVAAGNLCSFGLKIALVAYGFSDARYAVIETRSSSLSFATTGFISCVHGPLRAPCCMSHNCRAI